MYRIDVRRPFAGGVGHDAHDSFCYLIFGSEKRNGISIALAHLLSIDAGDGTRAF